MVEQGFIQPSCKYCHPLAYWEGFEGEMKRYFCFGERNNPSPVDSGDTHNFCVYTPFKGVVQFHLCQGDIDIWMAMFLAAWRQITGCETINWSVIENMAWGLTIREKD